MSDQTPIEEPIPYDLTPLARQIVELENELQNVIAERDSLRLDHEDCVGRLATARQEWRRHRDEINRLEADRDWAVRLDSVQWDLLGHFAADLEKRADTLLAQAREREYTNTMPYDEYHSRYVAAHQSHIMAKVAAELRALLPQQEKPREFQVGDLVRGKGAGTGWDRQGRIAQLDVDFNGDGDTAVVKLETGPCLRADSLELIEAAEPEIDTSGFKVGDRVSRKGTSHSGTITGFFISHLFNEPTARIACTSLGECNWYVKYLERQPRTWLSASDPEPAVGTKVQNRFGSTRERRSNGWHSPKCPEGCTAAGNTWIALAFPLTEIVGVL